MKHQIIKMAEKFGYKISKIDVEETYFTKRKRILEKLLTEECPVILDVGGHKGESVVEFKAIFTSSTVVSFEPDPDSYLGLVEACKPYKNVIQNNVGISNEENVGQQFFYKQSHSKLNSLNKINTAGNVIRDFLGSKNDDEADELTRLYNREIEVEVTTLDRYCASNGIDSVDLLKLDTQGHERECLQGAEKMLANTKVIFTEINFFDMYEVKYNFFDLEAILVPAGFSLYALPRLNYEKSSDKLGWVEAIYWNEKLMPSLQIGSF